MVLNISKRNKIILGVVLLLVVVGLMILSIFITTRQQQAKTDFPDMGEYYDANSGETISDPQGKDPDKFETEDGRPIFLGTSKFLDIGVSQYQVDALKEAFYIYSSKGQKNIKEVSISVDTINKVPRDRYSESTIETVLFDVVLDRKEKLKAKMEYFDLSAIRLYLSDSSNKLIYTSEVVDTLEASSHGEQ